MGRGPPNWTGDTTQQVQWGQGLQTMLQIVTGSLATTNASDHIYHKGMGVDPRHHRSAADLNVVYRVWAPTWEKRPSFLEPEHVRVRAE